MKVTAIAPTDHVKTSRVRGFRDKATSFRIKGWNKNTDHC